MNEEEITVNATVACAAWMVQHGLESEARSMRDEFLEQWDFHPDLWNRECDHLIRYAERKASAADAAHYEAIRIEIIEA